MIPIRLAAMALVCCLVGAAHAQRRESKAPALHVIGDGYTIQTFDTGRRAFGNRRYILENVPERFRGWQFTRLSGGERARLTVRGRRGQELYIATAPEQQSINLEGWKPVRRSTFAYSDKGHTSLSVYSRRLPNAKPISIPQGNWSGCMVLAPRFIAQFVERKPDHSLVPGVVVAHSPAHTRRYIGSPSLAVLADGRYVASHDFFGPGSMKNRTCVFGSRDRGKTWEQLADIKGQWWSSLFVHREYLYLIGTSSVYGSVVIRRSTDGGRTWTSPKNPQTGLLLEGQKYHCAPVPVVEHDGRIWRAMEDASGSGTWGAHFRAFMMSAPIHADLLNARSWTTTNRISRKKGWLGGRFGGWLEGNAVVTPEGSLANILRVDYRPRGGKAARIEISSDGRSARFDPTTGFFDFPGGCKKFTIRYDPPSKRYWSLTNYVQPRHRGSNPERVRNTVALIRSSDLRRWKVRGIVLYHPDTKSHGFQYLDWQFEDDDLIAVSRTAFDDGLGGAHNQHDANYLTFHRMSDFRTERRKR